jgi:hypothetical protein
LGIEHPDRRDLYRAARAGDQRELSLLLSLGWPVDTASKREPTALYLAAANGRSEVIPSLIAAGANRQFAAPDGTPIFGVAMIYAGLVSIGGQLVLVLVAALDNPWRSLQRASVYFKSRGHTERTVKGSRGALSCAR